MKIDPVGTAQPGEYTFVSPHSGFAYRFTPYAPGEKLRPEAKATADVVQGSAPLEVAFSAAGDLTHHWDFGDGTTSDASNPTHVYESLGQLHCNTYSDKWGRCNINDLPRNPCVASCTG